MKRQKFSRREFMSTLTAGAGAFLIGKNAFSFPSETSTPGSDPFQTVTLGKSGLKTTLQVVQHNPGRKRNGYRADKIFI